eukprot:Amastigsp_a339416_216.p1 type:complete len:217 gc:universal Amastigsp_a339416_216:690-40(-)
MLKGGVGSSYSSNAASNSTQEFPDQRRGRLTRTLPSGDEAQAKRVLFKPTPSLRFCCPAHVSPRAQAGPRMQRERLQSNTRRVPSPSRKKPRGRGWACRPAERESQTATRQTPEQKKQQKIKDPASVEARRKEQRASLELSQGTRYRLLDQARSAFPSRESDCRANDASGWGYQQRPSPSPQEPAHGRGRRGAHKRAALRLQPEVPRAFTKAAWSC